jgi:hypothetical protein
MVATTLPCRETAPDARWRASLPIREIPIGLRGRIVEGLVHGIGQPVIRRELRDDRGGEELRTLWRRDGEELDVAVMIAEARNSESAGLGQRQERGASVRGRTGGLDDRGPLLDFGGDERLERVRATPLRCWQAGAPVNPTSVLLRAKRPRKGTRTFRVALDQEESTLSVERPKTDKLVAEVTPKQLK